MLLEMLDVNYRRQNIVICVGSGYKKIVQKVRCGRSIRTSNGMLCYATYNYWGDANGKFKGKMKRYKKAPVWILCYKYQPQILDSIQWKDAH